MAKSGMPSTGKNTTAIFNPKTKSQNTNADTMSVKKATSKTKVVYQTDPDAARKNNPKAAAKADKVNSINAKSKSGNSNGDSKSSGSKNASGGSNGKSGGSNGAKKSADSKESDSKRGMTMQSKTTKSSAATAQAKASAAKQAKDTMNRTTTKTGFGSNKTVMAESNSSKTVMAKSATAKPKESGSNTKINTKESSSAKAPMAKSKQSGSNAKMTTTGSGSNSKPVMAKSSSNTKNTSIQGQKGIKGGVNSIMNKTKNSMSASAKEGMSMEAAEFCQLADMDMISDILGGQKALIKLYTTALCECDCPNLRTILTTQMTEAATDQFDAFLYMNQRGMYPTEDAEASKVKEAITQYTQKESAFNKKN